MFRRGFIGSASGIASGATPIAGDVTGTLAATVVAKVNGATVPASGALATGNAAYVSGVSALTYSALNLAGGSGWVTGVLPKGNQGAQDMAGDVTGSTAASVVAKVNGASVPAAGSLTTGNGAYVSGASALTYSALNLAGGSGYVTGALPAANQASQTMVGDVTGTTAASVVSTLTGTAGVVTVTNATSFNMATGQVYALKINAVTAATVGAGYIAIGSAAVASAGDLRLSATGAIKALDGSAADINVISCSSGVFTYGGTVNSGMVYGTSTSGNHSFQVNAVTALQIGASTAASATSIAATGCLRHRLGDLILSVRNAADGADLPFLSTPAAANTLQIGTGITPAAGTSAVKIFSSSSGITLLPNTTATSASFVFTASTLAFGEAMTPVLNQTTRTTDAATAPFTISGQAAFSTGGALTNTNGGQMLVRGGAISTSTAGGLKKGFRFDLSSVAGGQLIEGTEVIAGFRKLALNMAAALTTTSAPANTGDLVTLVGNAATVPTAAAVGAGIIYSNAGAGTWYGTGGTVTAFGPA